MLIGQDAEGFYRAQVYGKLIGRQCFTTSRVPIERFKILALDGNFNPIIITTNSRFVAAKEWKIDSEGFIVVRDYYEIKPASIHAKYHQISPKRLEEYINRKTLLQVLNSGEEDGSPIC